MNEIEAEDNKEEYFSPDSKLIEYLSERLKTSKRMDKLHKDGKEFPAELDSKNRSLNTKKVRILDNIVFKAMANLTFFFEAISLHPELQEIFESDIKNLLGVRYKGRQKYGFMFLNLLRSIMIIRDEDSQRSGNEQESELGLKQDGFRLRLIHIVQGIVLDKVEPFLPHVFKNYKAEHIVWEDLARAWAWTEMLAYHVGKEYGDPRRTFDFNTSELLEQHP